MSWPVSWLWHIRNSMTISSVPTVYYFCRDEIDEMRIFQSVFVQPCSIIHLGTFSSLYILSSSPFVSLLSLTLSPSQSSAPLSQDLGHWFCDSDLFVCVCVCLLCALSWLRLTVGIKRKMKTKTSSTVLTGNQDSGAHAARDSLMSFYLVAQ